MPNVLLFGCDKELVKRLAADSRWNVAIGVHGEEVSPDVPDPRDWQLVVDDCEKEENEELSAEELPEIPRHIISDDYLREAERAHGIRLCGEREHLGLWTGAPAGHKALEFHATGRKRSAERLIDFIDSFEGNFSRSRLRHVGRRWGPWECKPVFVDAYGGALVEFHEHYFPLLCSIDMASKDARIDALVYLCNVSVPRLWPRVYGDLFRPRRVVQLEQEQAKVIAERRKELAEIEREIQEELAFYAPYANLPWLGHHELKGLVADAFHTVFGFAVKDLDAELGESEPKTLDLIVEYGGWTAMLEVRGSSNRNARVDDLENLDDNYERAKEMYGETDSKLLVFNGMFGRDVEKRRRTGTFSELVVREAKTRKIGLLSAEELLRAIEAHRNEEMPVEGFVEALRSPGVFQPPWEG